MLLTRESLNSSLIRHRALRVPSTLGPDSLPFSFHFLPISSHCRRFCSNLDLLAHLPTTRLLVSRHHPYCSRHTAVEPVEGCPIARISKVAALGYHSPDLGAPPGVKEEEKASRECTGGWFILGIAIKSFINVGPDILVVLNNWTLKNVTPTPQVCDDFVLEIDDPVIYISFGNPNRDSTASHSTQNMQNELSEAVAFARVISATARVAQAPANSNL